MNKYFIIFPCNQFSYRNGNKLYKETKKEIRKRKQNGQRQQQQRTKKKKWNNKLERSDKTNKLQNSGYKIIANVIAHAGSENDTKRNDKRGKTKKMLWINNNENECKYHQVRIVIIEQCSIYRWVSMFGRNFSIIWVIL